MTISKRGASSVETETQNNKYPAAMRAAHPSTADRVPVASVPGVGDRHGCSFQRSRAAQRPRATVAGVERRQRAEHCEKALHDLIDAVEAEQGSRAPEIAQQLREVAVAVGYLANP
jgi:hypothetical protein